MMSFLRRISFKSQLFAENVTQIVSRHYSQKLINLSDVAVQKYLNNLIVEHNKLQSITKRNPEETRRFYEIKPITTVLESRITLFDSIESLKDLNKKESEDTEMKMMIKEEAKMYLKLLNEIDEELQTVLLQPNITEGGVLLEVAAGAGGQEAMLFARELFNMYVSYSKYKKWSVDIAGVEGSDLGGVRKASLLIEGLGVPEMMRVEAGVHRVQRIPTTEKGGRIHTSTVSVAVLPQPSDIELELPDRDLVIETKRASGAGGQHVNTTDSAVRIIHTPTGLAVECQEGRSQIKNKQIAIQKLRTLLLEKQINEQSSRIQKERKSQVGSGERNEKIRTYNFPQDRITEHRQSGATMHNIEAFMDGGEKLEELQESLLRHFRYLNILEEIEEFKKKHMIESSS